MNKSYLILPVFLLNVHFCFAQKATKIHVAKFKDNKTCAISYTFDDGLEEHYSLVTPRLNELGLRATFVINGAIINKDEKNITDTTRMSWENLKEMSASGQEISNHGWMHKNFGKFSIEEIKEDIYKNDSAIYANIGIMPRTFVYPNNAKTPEGVKIASENRVGTRLYEHAVGGKSTPENLESWVNKLVKDHDWGITMTHGITYGYDHFKSADILWDHFKKVKALEDQIWVGTFREVATYAKERDSTTLAISQAENGDYTIIPLCRLDKMLFTEKLTAILDEKNIREVDVRQGKNRIKAKINADRILFDFDPFGEAIYVQIKKRNRP